jgi:hypothetical protein
MSRSAGSTLDRIGHASTLALGWDFITGKVARCDQERSGSRKEFRRPKTQKVETSHGVHAYDYLVIAIGYLNDFDVIPGLGPGANA